MKKTVSLLLISCLLTILSNCNQPSKPPKDVLEKTPLLDFRLSEMKEPDGWVKFRRTKFIYDKNERVIKEISKKLDGDSTILEFRRLRNYDADGKEILIIMENWKDEKWAFASQSTFQYESEKIVHKIDSNANSVSKTTFSYDPEGKLLSEVQQKNIGDSIVNSAQKILKYNKQDLIIEREHQRWSGKEWMNSLKMIMSYNDKGYRIQTTRYNWKDSIWVEGIHYEHEVDESGVRLSDLYQKSDENGIKKDLRRETYSYHH